MLSQLSPGLTKSASDVGNQGQSDDRYATGTGQVGLTESFGRRQMKYFYSSLAFSSKCCPSFGQHLLLIYFNPI